MGGMHYRGLTYLFSVHRQLCFVPLGSAGLGGSGVVVAFAS